MNKCVEASGRANPSFVSAGKGRVYQKGLQYLKSMKKKPGHTHK